MKTALVTGSSGFIGFHVSVLLLNNGWRVIGFDNLNEYYDVNLKLQRQNILLQHDYFKIINASLEEADVLKQLFKAERPELVVHLAAQAGVRYSIENPRTYFESNLLGTFELLEACRIFRPEHLLVASTSSAYGATATFPNQEIDPAEHQISFYAATKKASENLSHSFANAYSIPTTVFRFFTVYGPWGRPDMALFKFTKNILAGQPIDVYNNGDMFRDFTYINDLANNIIKLTKCVPVVAKSSKIQPSFDTLSHVAPFRLVNIGNGAPENLMDFIHCIEKKLNKKAIINYLPMQQGDVKATWADTRLLHHLIGKQPTTSIENGVNEFVEWYLKYYGEVNIT